MPANPQGNNLLSTDLSIWPTFGNPVTISDAIYGSQTLKANLINRLLLYDQIVIPSGNLLILAVLRLWLGDSAVRLLLENEILVLVRYNRWFCYVGNGGGLKFFGMSPGDTPETKEHNLTTLNFAPLEETISKVLKVTNPPTSEEERKTFEKLLNEKVKTISLAQYQDKLRHETYTDILKSPLLRSFFEIRNKHLDHLRGINPDQVQIEDFHSTKSSNFPEISAVLRIAFENLLLTIASETTNSINTIQADLSSEKVLKAKGQRLGIGRAEFDGFLSLIEIANVPNVGNAFVSGEISFNDVLRLRESREAKEFRRWLVGVDPLTQEEVVKEYVQSLQEKQPIERLPLKAIRFLTTSVLSSIPGLGQAASFADSFLLEKWFPGRSPKLLLDEIRRVVIKEPQRPKGSIRNRPCPCGSGKKFKKCCGN